MRRAAAVTVIIVLVAVAAAFLYLRRGHDYEISQAEIQSQVESQFPVERCVLVFCIELTRPSVQLDTQQSRIAFGSDALMEIAFSAEKYNGSVAFSGALTYRPEQGAFYLDDSRLESLQVDGISKKHKDNLDKLASLLVTEYLRTNPVYSFKETIFEPVAPWLELKEVDMRDAMLRVRLGLAL